MDSTSLLIAAAAGSVIGCTIGFITASILAARDFRRISADSWAAAHRYYTRQK